MKDRNTEKGEKEGVKATTLILIFEEVNRHRTLSGPTSPRPTVDRRGEGGWQGRAFSPPHHLLSLPSPAQLEKSLCKWFSGSSQKRNPQRNPPKVMSYLAGISGMRGKKEKQRKKINIIELLVKARYV